MTILLNSTVEKSFDPAIRAHVRTALSKFRTRMLDRTQHGYYPDAETEHRVAVLLNELDSLPLSELLANLKPFDYGIIRRGIPEMLTLPGNTSFVGPDPVTESGALQVLCLGVELAKAWPESLFELTVHEPDSEASEETIRATTLRDGFKYLMDLDAHSFVVTVQEPDSYSEGEWTEADAGYYWVGGSKPWTSIASFLPQVRSCAILRRGLTAQGLSDAPELDIDDERPLLTLTVGAHKFHLSATDAFHESNEEALPALIADGVFAELARSAGLERTAEVGRQRVAAVFTNL